MTTPGAAAEVAPLSQLVTDDRELTERRIQDQLLQAWTALLYPILPSDHAHEGAAASAPTGDTPSAWLATGSAECPPWARCLQARNPFQPSRGYPTSGLPRLLRR
jgi:hypothetical protein